MRPTDPGTRQLLFNTDAVLFTTSCVVISVCHTSVPGDLTSFATQPVHSVLWTTSNAARSFFFV
jgi:hypothetical protein